MRTLLLTAVVAAAPALADVKAGVDAWGHGDYKAAVEQWRGPAAAGNADAAFNLGQAYKLGRGVPVDEAQAERWFRTAAMKGHTQAQDNYGLALFQDHKLAEALPWLEKSVVRGEPRAELVLGTMLFNGDGVERDYPRAYALLTRAAAQGLPAAAATLAQMDTYMSPADHEKGTLLARRYAARPSATPQTARAPTPSGVRPAATSGGGWRVQLGAFRDRSKAEALWSAVHRHMVGATPSYISAGNVTRLVVGGFASKAEAYRACDAVSISCLVVAP